jgi:cell division protein FtsA
MEEIVVHFFYQIRKSGYADKLGAGIVITGGTSLLPNLSQLIKFHTGFDVRIGKPNLNNFVPRKEVYDPRFSTVLGLLHLAAAEGSQLKGKKRQKKNTEPTGPGIISKVQTKIVQTVISFFDENTADSDMSDPEKFN